MISTVDPEILYGLRHTPCDNWGKLPILMFPGNSVMADLIPPTTLTGLVARHDITYLATNPIGVAGCMASAVM